MHKQHNMLNKAEAERQRDKGMEKSLETANQSTESWTKIAYDYLLKYASENKVFMTEEVRTNSIGVVPDPPSNRAWGAIVREAARSGLIFRIGYRPTKSAKSHRTPATVWCVR